MITGPAPAEMFDGIINIDLNIPHSFLWFSVVNILPRTLCQQFSPTPIICRARNCFQWRLGLRHKGGQEVADRECKVDNSL